MTTERPKYRSTDIKSLVRAAEPKPTVYVVYNFRGRQFTKKDRRTS